jgi:RNA methyltransferase, TrmH family
LFSDMTTISSSHNPQLAELRRLARRRGRERSGRFVAEGEDLLAAADAAGWTAVERYCVAGSGLPGREVDERALHSVSTLGSGTRAAGVYAQRWARPAGPLCIYLHGVGDPGNVGAVLRAALAFGAASVVLGPGCADPYGPKAVRASMGALFAVPVARLGGAPADLGELPGERIALVARAGDPLRGPLAPAAEATILVGAERNGLPPEVVEACDRIAHIAIAAESLNAAMAATVALYELNRIAP